jgi:hypothetical protein
MHYVVRMSSEWNDQSDGLDYEVDPEVEEEWLAEWDEAERQGVEVLRQALASHRGQPAPAEELIAAANTARARLGDEEDYSVAWVRRAADLKAAALPEDDSELLIRLVAGTISLEDETGLDVEEEALLMSLEMADWLGAIVSIVRDGAGADASPNAMVEGVRNCPEVELEAELGVDDESHINAAFWIVAVPWQILGIVDPDHRLTELGEWILPRALARAWNGDFDRESDSD